MKKLKVGDRVRRLPAPGISDQSAELNAGSQGVVKTVKEETASSATVSSPEARDRALMYQVQWDNGTLSYFGPDRLEVV